MEREYDIYVDEETLNQLRTSLSRIIHNLENSVAHMSQSLQYSEAFLAGAQYQKAQEITRDCLDKSKKTISNLNEAKRYLDQLETVLEEYGKCRYNGGME